MMIFVKTGEYELTPELVRSLAATYPAVNVRNELARMYLWTLKNPSRRWELPLRGIETWLRKASKKALEAREKNRAIKAKQDEQNYLNGMKARKLTPVTDAWWTSDAGVNRKAAELGMVARPGEGWPQFKARVAEMEKMKRELRQG